MDHGDMRWNNCFNYNSPLNGCYLHILPLYPWEGSLISLSPFPSYTILASPSPTMNSHPSPSSQPSIPAPSLEPLSSTPKRRDDLPYSLPRHQSLPGRFLTPYTPQIHLGSVVPQSSLRSTAYRVGRFESPLPQRAVSLGQRAL